MNIQDIIAPIKDQLIVRWEALQESSLYNELKEKYENLSPTVQKIIIWSSIAIVVVFLLSFPLGLINSAGDSITEFEDKRQTTLNLLDVVQEIKNSPPAPQRLNSSELKARIEKVISDSGFLPEQVKNLQEEASDSSKKSRLIPKSVSESAVLVEINKLNLKQIVDFEYQLSKISPIIKVMSLELFANQEDNHYYNVNYRVVSFNVHESGAPSSPEKDQEKAKPTHE